MVYKLMFSGNKLVNSSSIRSAAESTAEEKLSKSAALDETKS